MTKNNVFSLSTEQRVTEGAFSGSPRGDMLQFEEERALYKKLKKDPGLLVQDKKADDFFKKADKKPLAALHDAESLMESLWAIPETERKQLSKYEQDIQTLSKELQRLDSLYNPDYETDTENLQKEYEKWRQEKDAVAQKLSDAVGKKRQIEAGLTAERKTKAATALTLNEGVQASTKLEHNRSAINRLILQTIAVDKHQVNAEQEGVLRALAGQCALEGGVAVLQARVLYRNLIDPAARFDDDALCGATENPNIVERDGPFVLGTMKLYPNPATHTLTLMIPANYPEQGLSLRITNLMGGTVYNAPLAGGLQSMDIPLAGIPGGVYLCSLFDQEKVLETQKIIIIR